MAHFVVLNDNTLRRRLRQYGFKPDGPITDTTRDVYVRKLQQLERAAQSNLTAGQMSMVTTTASRTIPFYFGQPLSQTAFPVHQNGTNNATLHGGVPRTHSAAFNHQSRRFSDFTHGSRRNNNRQSEPVARSAPLENASSSNVIVHGSLGNRFLANFNDRTHVTSDVCFVLQDNTLVFASRALLVTSCPGMTQLLYNTSESFPISLHMVTGSMIVWCHLDDLVWSVKCKITLLKGIPVISQILLLDGRPLPDDATLNLCGVRTNCILEVQASPEHPVVNFRATSINPFLSVVRLSALPSARGSHELSVMSQVVSLPYQVVRLIVVSDISATLLHDFIHYLYTGNIAVTMEMAPTLCALSETFTIADLQELSLKVIDDNINNGNIKDLLSFSNHNQVQCLKDHCLRYIRTHHCNLDELCQHFFNNPELVQDILNNNNV